MAHLSEQLNRMKFGENQSLAVMTQILLENDCDSFTISTVDNDEFGNFIKKCTKNSQIGDQSKQILIEIKKRIKMNLKWSHIAHAVSHEMTPKLGELVQKVSTDAISEDTRPKGTVEKVMDRVRKQKIRKLLLSESRYLRDLVDRACHPLNHSLVPLSKKCLFYFNITRTSCQSLACM